MNKKEFKKLLEQKISVKEQIIIFCERTGHTRNTFFRWKYNLLHNRPLRRGRHNYYRNSLTSCYFCDTTSNLVTHHIDGNHSNDLENNLLSLCSSCHKRLHLLLQKS